MGRTARTANSQYLLQGDTLHEIATQQFGLLSRPFWRNGAVTRNLNSACVVPLELYPTPEILLKDPAYMHLVC